MITRTRVIWSASGIVLAFLAALVWGTIDHRLHLPYARQGLGLHLLRLFIAVPLGWGAFFCIWFRGLQGMDRPKAVISLVAVVIILVTIFASADW